MATKGVDVEVEENEAIAEEIEEMRREREEKRHAGQHPKQQATAAKRLEQRRRSTRWPAPEQRSRWEVLQRLKNQCNQ